MKNQRPSHNSGVAALTVGPPAKWEPKPLLAGGRIDRNDVQSRDEDRVRNAVGRGDDRRRVAGGFIGGMPDGFAIGEGERDNPALAATDIYQHVFPSDDGRAPGAEIAIRDVEIGVSVASPDFLAVVQTETDQIALGAEYDNAAATHKRYAAGSVVLGNGAGVARGRRRASKSACRWRIPAPRRVAGRPVDGKR